MSFDLAFLSGYSVFAFWVIFLGGAERLEGCLPSFKEEMLSRLLVPAVEAPAIRLYVIASWLIAFGLLFL